MKEAIHTPHKLFNCPWVLIGDNGDSVSSFTTSDNNLFLSAFVDYSTDIAVMIMAFLMYMPVLAGQRVPVSFSMKFNMNKGLNSE